MTCNITYYSNSDSNRHTRDPKHPWSEWDPEKIKSNAAQEVEDRKFALIVRHETDPSGPKISLHSVTIQSPYIRDFLTPVFDGYPGVHPNIGDFTLRAPFREFFHRWEILEMLFSKIQDPIARAHVK